MGANSTVHYFLSVAGHFIVKLVRMDDQWFFRKLIVNHLFKKFEIYLKERLTL